MKKILLASDGSSYSDDAAWLLAHLPHDEPLDLVVATILDVPATNRNSLSREWIDQCIAQERERAGDTFASVQAMLEGATLLFDMSSKRGELGRRLLKSRKRNKSN